MLYFVSVNGIDADYPLDDYDNFIVEADSEQNLAAAIVAARMDCGEDSKELDNSVWRVRVSWAKSSTTTLILSTFVRVSVFS